MNRLQLPHAKLFYIVSQMFKKNRINEDQKRILKEKTISDDLQIFQILDKYERNKNEEELCDNLLKLVKGNGFNFVLNEVSNANSQVTHSTDHAHEANMALPTNGILTNINAPDQISSPWAGFLRKKKLDHNKETALQGIQKNILEPHNASKQG